MTLELAQIATTWPLGASLAALAAQGWRAGRRRSALNEALHELRRPLQALALATPGAGRGPGMEGTVEMAATALERLEREINGSAPAPERATLAAQGLARAAVERWRGRALLANRELSLRWRAGAAAVDGNPGELARALDNLIVNAIEHGGGEIVVEGRRAAAGLELAVVDRGPGSQSQVWEGKPTELIARLRGKGRHGHGLKVVRRAAAAHGGDFRLHRHERGTEAVLELPLAGKFRA